MLTQQKYAPQGVFAGLTAVRVDALKVVALAALLALSAQVRFYPPGSAVPVTMQTMAALLCGFWLRPRLAATAVGLYLAAGLLIGQVATGVSLFAAFAAGASATLGYLFGFLPAAVVVSLLAGKVGRLTLGRAWAIGAVGTLVIFAAGWAWLTWLLGSAETALMAGVLPFAGWAGVKVLAAGALAAACRRQ